MPQRKTNKMLYYSKIKTNIQLFPDLSTKEKEQAYEFMSYVFQPAFYNRVHSVSAEAAEKIVTNGLGIITGYSTVMH